MSFLAWNCRGSGGSLSSSPTMLHLSRLAYSTNAQGDFTVDVVQASANLILGKAVYKPLGLDFSLICIYGDPHHIRTDAIWNDVLSFVVKYQDMPALCLGDMNNLMHANEKLGPNPVNLSRVSHFCHWVKQCGLFDLGYNGPAYTWSNRRFASNPTFERLDRGLVNSEWCNVFPNTAVFHLPVMHSDHAPILIKTDTSARYAPKPFRFENWWILENDFQEIAKQSWLKSSHRSFSSKTSFLAKDLKIWRKKKPKLADQLQQLESQILCDQQKPYTQQNHSLQENLIQQHHSVLLKESEFHRQRVKKIWAVKGDKNTKFFQRAIIKRAMKNRIAFLVKEDGSPVTTQDQIAQTFKNYFLNIFASQTNNLVDPPQYAADFREADQIQDVYTNSIPDRQEIIQIMNNMRSDASPGPDGLNAAFYKASWSWIADDVINLIQDFYTSGHLPQGINSTHIALIPKCNNAHAPRNFRPISLCNVIYKIISKSLAERIKIHLPNYIHYSQSAFIPGRHITSNVIVAQEITHSFRLRNWNQKAFLLQVDLAKAFDRLEWNFVVKALHNRGFSHHFIQLIHSCISSPTFSILVNGQPYFNFKSQRGIRQGCPLSPYLFVLAIYELSVNLQQALRGNHIQGITLGPSCPPIHSLLFADDLIICGQATQQEAVTINEVLQNFCALSGQTPNWNKSAILFSKKVSATDKNVISSIFPAPPLTNKCSHLGHPLIFSYKDRAAAYNFIANKFHAKLSCIKANKLSHAGRLTYLKSVLASIPLYYMTNILFPANFLHKLDSIMRNFWWTGIQEENSTHPIAFRAWEDVCKPKILGGLGLKKMALVNKSLVLHSAWMVINGKDPFLTNILKSKYFHNTSF
ncbi:hypothetical protein U9M48_037298 [Paspalum notatum var. saurae]|uniref:Reverse transcriptase domain-containing protein n=1 Tax=Paspalum notatum var. saurae TaxID=547442 RepID=A0AAQ3UFB8_PASNO